MPIGWFVTQDWPSRGTHTTSGGWSAIKAPFVSSFVCRHHKRSLDALTTTPREDMTTWAQMDETPFDYTLIKSCEVCVCCFETSELLNDSKSFDDTAKASLFEVEDTNLCQIFTSIQQRQGLSVSVNVS